MAKRLVSQSIAEHDWLRVRHLWKSAYAMRSNVSIPRYLQHSYA